MGIYGQVASEYWSICSFWLQTLQNGCIGEYPIGISFEYPAIQLKRQGAPLDIILPQEGLGWDIEATAIIKGTNKRDAAQNWLIFPPQRKR